MSTTMRDKELVAVAIAVAAGCRPCATHYLTEARRAGASDAAIEKAVAGAVCVRTSATEAMRCHALGLAPAPDGCGCASTEATAELVALGAALAVNCTGNIDKHLAAARALGLPQEHLDAVFALVTKIRSRATGHATARFSGAGAQAAGDTPAAGPALARCC